MIKTEYKWKWNAEKLYSERAVIYQLINLDPKLITTPQELIEYASQITSIPVDVIFSNIRFAEVVATRYAIITILRDKFLYSLEHIGTIMGRDHSTVIHGLRQVDSWQRFPNQYIVQNRILNQICNRCIFYNDLDVISTIRDINRKIAQTLDDVEKYRELLKEIENLQTA